MTRSTASGRPAVESEDSSVPDKGKKPDGQYNDHWVLSPEERSKGYVRPVLISYIHVGLEGPKNPLRDLTEDEHKRYNQYGYIKYEEYPKGYGPSGMFWTQERLDKIGKGCKETTRMPIGCAETYAAKPDYYGSTFCCGCNKYLPVGAHGEFIWADGSNKRVGT